MPASTPKDLSSNPPLALGANDGEAGEPAGFGEARLPGLSDRGDRLERRIPGRRPVYRWVDRKDRIEGRESHTARQVRHRLRVGTMHRVVITGIGIVAPNAKGAPRLRRRRSARDAPASATSRASTRPGSRSRSPARSRTSTYCPYLGEHKKNAKLMSRAVRFAVGAAAMAVEDSGIEDEASRPDAIRRLHGDRDHADGHRRAGRRRFATASTATARSTWRGSPWPRSESIFPLWLLKHLPNMAAAHISILHQAMGPNNTIVTACAAGTQAVGEAFRLIARGDADVMLAGGCDSRLDPLLMVAYSAMKAVSSSTRPPSEVSRPFDGERDGFVLGEGAAVLMLESHQRARQRGRPDLRRGHRLRLVVRRLRHHPPRARRQGRGAVDDVGPAGGPARRRPTSTTSTPTARARGSTT